MRISIELDLLCSLGQWSFAGCYNEGWATGKRRDNGDIEVRGGAVLNKDRATLRRMPRLSEPCPRGLRAGHGSDFGEQAATATYLCNVQVVATLLQPLS